MNKELIDNCIELLEATLGDMTEQQADGIVKSVVVILKTIKKII